MDNESDILDEAVDTPCPPGPELTERQRQVHRDIRQVDRQIAGMYLGAIHVLTQAGNPDRFPQAAHSLREVIEKLAERIGGPIAAGPSLKVKVQELRKSYPSDALAGLYGESIGLNPSSPKLRKFLEKAASFFTWFDENRPTGHEGIGRFLGAIDPRGRRLPRDIERNQTKRWIDVRDELQAISHHRRTPSALEFRRIFESLDSLLLEVLHPKTFEHFDEIDKIIAEAEQSE